MAANAFTSLSQAALLMSSTGAEGMNQDVYMTGQPVAMFTQDPLDADEPPAEVPGASLASGQENKPPCHQLSKEEENMEESSVESPTVIPSEPRYLSSHTR